MTHSDDLGRVVVPKEIRKTLHIREGDPLEIFTDREGEIILKKYSPIGELGALPDSMPKRWPTVQDILSVLQIGITILQWLEMASGN